jgi:hypothetical protein
MSSHVMSPRFAPIERAPGSLSWGLRRLYLTSALNSFAIGYVTFGTGMHDLAFAMEFTIPTGIRQVNQVDVPVRSVNGPADSWIHHLPWSVLSHRAKSAHARAGECSPAWLRSSIAAARAQESKGDPRALLNRLPALPQHCGS